MLSSEIERGHVAQAAWHADPVRTARAVLGPALACAGLLAPVFAGHEGMRLWQVLVLALPTCLWLWWPLRTRGRRLAQGLLCLGLGLGFVLDGAVRGFLLAAYDAPPNSAMVLSAVANTSGQESREFASMLWRDLVAWAGFALACGGALAGGLLLWWRSPPARPSLPARPGRRALALAAGALLLAAIAGAFGSKPWRRHHPVLFWPQWAQDVADLRRQWTGFARQRTQLLAGAAALAPALSKDGPDTLVLVISESELILSPSQESLQSLLGL